MKKRDYLNDYKLSANGEYVYTGKYYTYVDINGFKKNRFNIIFLTAVCAFAVIMSGCINSSGMNNSFYVILPYAAEVASVFALCWNVVRLAKEGDSIKEYVYASVTKNIPNAAKSLMLFSAVGLIGTIVYFIIHNIRHDLDYSVAYPIIKIITFLITLLLLKTYKIVSFEQK